MSDDQGAAAIVLLNIDNGAKVLDLSQHATHNQASISRRSDNLACPTYKSRKHGEREEGLQYDARDRFRA
jgi:hypothetical protein